MGDTGLGHGADNDYDDDDADDDEDDNDDYYCRVVLSDASCAVLSDPDPVVPSDPATQLLCGCGWQQDKNAVNQFISLFIHAHSHQLSINNQNVQPSP
jgi:hypothetical protein